MKKDDPVILEAIVRSLRDKVFCHQISDKSWECVRHHWMRPDSVRWLNQHAAVSLKYAGDDFVTVK